MQAKRQGPAEKLRVRSAVWQTPVTGECRTRTGSSARPSVEGDLLTNLSCAYCPVFDEIIVNSIVKNGYYFAASIFPTSGPTGTKTRRLTYSFRRGLSSLHYNQVA